MKCLKTLVILSVLLIIPCVAKSAVIETWECTAPNESEPRIIAQINEGGKTGQITVAEIAYDPFVYTGVFFRRWDFGLNESHNSHYNYALIIKSEGKGLYFDFSEGDTVEPSQRLKCKMR